MLKNKILILSLLTCLCFPLQNFAENEFYNDVTSPTQEYIENVEENYQQKEETSNLPDNLIENSELLKHKEGNFKQPSSKKMIAKRFGFAMFGVIVSSLLIFVMLTIYNKIRDKFLNKENKYIDEDSLDTPNSLIDAVNIFLNKTK